MDAQLQTVLDAVKRATTVAVGHERDEVISSALRAALAMRRLQSSVDMLVRTFSVRTTTRDVSLLPPPELTRAARANLEELIERSERDAKNVVAMASPLVAGLLEAGHATEAVEVREATDSLVGSLTLLRALTDEMIDVLILREAELDPENDEPPVPLAEVLAGLDKVA